MGAVLSQADDSDETRKAEDEEEKGGSCMFDCNITGLRLRPVLFLSCRINPKSRETAIERLRCFLFGKEFTWITDCEGLKTFMETEARRPLSSTATLAPSTVEVLLHHGPSPQPNDDRRQHFFQVQRHDGRMEEKGCNQSSGRRPTKARTANANRDIGDVLHLLFLRHSCRRSPPQQLPSCRNEHHSHSQDCSSSSH